MTVYPLVISNTVISLTVAPTNLILLYEYGPATLQRISGDR